MFIIIVVTAVILGMGGFKKDRITYGSIGAELKVPAVIVRDESLVTASRYEKLSYYVLEGQSIENGTAVCEIYKRGYQDDSMVQYLNLSKQIYAYQMQLLGDSADALLADVNARIRTVEEQIASSARGSGIDMLTLEATLKSLLDERTGTLKNLVAPDETLNKYYTDLANEEASIQTWKQKVVNNAGSGLISFYFDGYEQSLNASKISMINSHQINEIVKKNNTKVGTEYENEVPLYRLINPGHWLLAFVTDADDPLRLTAGEAYYITFPEFSQEDMYYATAREPIVSQNDVVNILELYMDIGKLVDVRTVNASITKSAQGLVVPVDAIDIIDGIAGLNIELGETIVRVEIDVLAEDGDKAVIREKNSSGMLAVGQKYIKP